jgi:hypothetical protein
MFDFLARPLLDFFNFFFLVFYPLTPVTGARGHTSVSLFVVYFVEPLLLGY